MDREQVFKTTNVRPLLRTVCSFASLLVGLSVISVPASSQTCYDLLARADSLVRADKPDSAFVVAKLALARAEEEFGPSDTAVARACHVVGRLGFYNELIAETIPYFQRATSIREHTLGPDHPDVAESLLFLGFGYAGTNQTDKYLLCTNRAQAIMESNYGYESEQVADIINLRAQYYHDLGWLDEADQLYREAMVIIDKVLPPDHSNLIQYLNTYSALLADRGDYANAVSMVERALIICERDWGKDHTMSAGNRANLASMYILQGKCEDAERILRSSVIIGERSLGPDSRYVEGLLASISDALVCQGRYAEAEPLLRRAIAILDKIRQEGEIDDKAGELIRLAFVCKKQGRIQEATGLLLQSLAITERNPTERDNVDHIRVLLAELAGLGSRPVEADSLFRKALEGLERMYGPETPPMADALESYARFLHGAGRVTESLENSKRALDIRVKNFAGNVPVLTERDALQFSRALRTSAFNYISCAYNSEILDGSASEEIATVILSSKVQVSDGVFERRNTFMTGRGQAGDSLWNVYRRTKASVAHKYIKGPGETSIDRYRRELDSLTESAERLEAELSRVRADFNTAEDWQKINVAGIASLLPEGATLIEYLKFDLVRTDGDAGDQIYLLLAVNSGGRSVVRVLGQAAEIDGLITRYRAHLLRLASESFLPGEQEEAEYRLLAREIFGRVVEPAESMLKSGSTLFIGPDGGLNLLSFAGLVTNDDRYLIEKHPVHYLSAGRDLIRLKVMEGSGKGLVAFGDPDFDATVEIRLSDQTGDIPDRALGADPLLLRNVRSECGTLREMFAPRLPWTRDEVVWVARNWAESRPSNKPTVYLGPQANEDLFKLYSTGKSIIHLATHGYFLQGECSKASFETNWGHDNVGENPLLQSGFFLSGANLHGEGAEEMRADDGIVTALEVTSLDLRGTDLVVLSACETGLGEVTQGEGVYGLRRAFQLAGARTVVSSLWQVPDDEAMKFMKQLYSNEAGTYPELMQKVAIQKLNELRARKRPTHPFTWGAFIATGDWRRR